MSNPYTPPPEVDTSIVKLYDAIRITVRREAEIISAVFPQPIVVLQVFLQRVFAQSVMIIIIIYKDDFLYSLGRLFILNFIS